MGSSKLLLIPFALAAGQLFASVSVQLTAPSSTIRVGDTLYFSATAKDSATTNTRFSYQFTMRPHNQGAFMVMQDYYWQSYFPWTPSDHEGVYDIGVTAWSSATQNSAPTYITVTVQSRVTGSTPVLSNTLSTLVALYSAPACSAPAQMRVQFSTSSEPNPIYTPYKTCNGLSMNFYLGGMKESTTYSVQHFLQSGSSLTPGPQMSYTTGNVPSDIKIPNHFRLSGPTPPTSVTYPYLLHVTDGAAPYATDLNENVVWYRTLNGGTYDSGYMSRLVAGGTFLTQDDDPVNSRAICGSIAATACGDHQFLRELDMAGNIIRQTSWSILNDEVNTLRKSQGGSQVRLNFLSHEAIRLPNGYTALIATDEQVKQRTSGAADMFADMIIVIDTNWQVAWAWDSFDYLDINRMSLTPGICTLGGAGCPSQFFSKQANGKPYTSAIDWTHANALYYDQTDGSLVMSFRNQSWVIKINYGNAHGNGNIIWKLGYGGSFTLAAGYPVSDWFSGQHNPEFQSNGLLTLFDNNNASSLTDQPGGDAHGQAWQVDTTHMIATPIQNVDLGVVSQAVGSATLLNNGNYEWQAGFINNDQAQTFEYTPSGTLVYHSQSDALTYRSFRLTDLYTPH